MAILADLVLRTFAILDTFPIVYLMISSFDVFILRDKVRPRYLTFGTIG